MEFNFPLFVQIRKFIGDKSVKLDRELFRRLTEVVAEIFKKKYDNFQMDDNNIIHLCSEDVLSIEREIGESTLKMNYIKLDRFPISLKNL